jgi:hypothetical protein
MALEYTATLAGELKVVDVLEWLSSVPGFKEDNGKLIAPDLQISINKTTGLASLVIEDEFGFSPSVSVSFRLNKFGDPVSMRKQIVRAVSSLLQHTLEDTVFLFNGQTVVLQRIKEKLELNRIEGFWVNVVKELVVGSYEFRDIPGI